MPYMQQLGLITLEFGRSLCLTGLYYKALLRTLVKLLPPYDPMCPFVVLVFLATLSL